MYCIIKKIVQGEIYKSLILKIIKKVIIIRFHFNIILIPFYIRYQLILILSYRCFQTDDLLYSETNNVSVT